ncbi:MAG: hypothetical protein ACK53Y_22250, partial [bacterium]
LETSLERVLPRAKRASCSTSYCKISYSAITDHRCTSTDLSAGESGANLRITLSLEREIYFIITKDKMLKFYRAS